MYAPVHYELFDHPKTAKLAKTLKIRVAEAGGLLAALWGWSLIYDRKQADSGDISDYTDRAIAKACHWEGNASDFVNALVECGWLDGNRDDDDNPLRIHDFAEHNAQLLKRREQDRIRQARKRAGDKALSRVTDVRDVTYANSQKSIVNSQKEREKKEEVSPSVFCYDETECGKTLKELHQMGIDTDTAFLDSLTSKNGQRMATDVILWVAQKAKGADNPTAYFESVCKKKHDQNILTMVALSREERKRRTVKPMSSSDQRDAYTLKPGQNPFEADEPVVYEPQIKPGENPFDEDPFEQYCRSREQEYKPRRLFDGQTIV